MSTRALAGVGRDLAALPVHGGDVTGTITLTDTGATGELAIKGVQARSGDVGATIAFAPARSRPRSRRP